MSLLQLLYSVILIATIICAVFLIGYSRKRLQIPGARYFILLLLTAIIYNGAYIGELNSSRFSYALFWFHVEHIAIPLQHYFWLMMCLDYIQIDRKYLNKIKYIALYHPLIYYFVYYTNDFFHLYITSYGFESNGYFYVITTTKGFMYTAVVISGTLFGMVAAYFYLRGCIKAPKLTRQGYVVMLIASLFPWATVYSIASSSNYLGIDYYPVVTSISGLLYLLGIFRFRIFRTIPIATEIVFRQSKEGILLLDNMNCIIEANESAVCLYPELSKLSENESLDKFVHKHPEFQDFLLDIESLRFLHENEQGSKYYQATVTNIKAGELHVGKIITFSDITEQHEEQKELELIAMNAIDKAETNEISFLQAQINPHFINNTLSVIGSMITRAPEEARDLIADLGDYLANCYYFDSASGMHSLEKELEVVQTYVKIEKARFRERLHFHLIYQEIPSMNIPRLVLQPLVENAIRHGILKRAEGGEVELMIERKKNGILFVVKDDGIGITEDAIRFFKSGIQEDKGIGLINVNLRLRKYYKEELTIKKEERGTSISFLIPYQEEEKVEV